MIFLNYFTFEILYDKQGFENAKLYLYRSIYNYNLTSIYFLPSNSSLYLPCLSFNGFFFISCYNMIYGYLYT